MTRPFFPPFRENTETILRFAHGLDNRPVIPDEKRQSLGRELTFEKTCEIMQSSWKSFGTSPKKWAFVFEVLAFPDIRSR